MNFTDFLKANKPEWFNLDHGHDIIARAIDTAATCKQDALILAPPRCGKSTIFADLLPRWLTEVRKIDRIIIACENDSFASHWRKRFAEVSSEGAQRRVKFIGAGAPITGCGADVFILDSWSHSHGGSSLRDWYISTVQSRLMPGGIVLAVGNRVDDEDFASYLARRDSSDLTSAFNVSVLPVRPKQFN